MKVVHVICVLRTYFQGWTIDLVCGGHVFFRRKLNSLQRSITQWGIGKLGYSVIMLEISTDCNIPPK